MIRHMWMLGDSPNQQSTTEPSPLVAQAGMRISLAGESSREVTLSALLKLKGEIFGFSVGHGFQLENNKKAIVQASGQRLDIGIYNAAHDLNKKQIQDLTDYIRFFRLSERVRCAALNAQGERSVIAVPQNELSDNNVYRTIASGNRVHARVVRMEAGTYLRDRTSSDEHRYVSGGILIRPEVPTELFVGPGDSGTLIFTSTGEALGVVVARDEEYVLVAPIFESLKRRKLEFISLNDADSWNTGATDLRTEPEQLTSANVRSYAMSSEAVSEGHPNKVSDRISDEIVDLIYREALKTRTDPSAIRVDCQVMTTTNRIVIAGEVRVPFSLMKVQDGHEVIDPAKFKQVARKAVKDIGYEQDGFHWKQVKIDVLLHAWPLQPTHEDQTEDGEEFGEEGAGDAGTVYGYAVAETPDLMPAPIYYANRVLNLISAARREGSGDAGMLGPDAKCQIVVRYKDKKPVEISTITIAIQHLDQTWDSLKVRRVVEPYVREAFGGIPVSDDCLWYINPAGKFVIGGPDRSAGMTGQEVSGDTYGGLASQGGGLSGGDSTKIQRSGAYAARYIAKNVVAAGIAHQCSIQLSYAVGVSQPVSIFVDLHGTANNVREDDVEAAIRRTIDLSPAGIRKHLGLNKPIFARTSAYGHFGRRPSKDGGFSWERLDLVNALLEAIKT